MSALSRSRAPHQLSEQIVRAEPAAMQGVTRYFVVNSGRSGSTLLSVILAEAGAQFDLPIPRSWNPVGGEMEHPLGLRATAAFRRTSQAGSTKPEGWLQRRAWQLHRSHGRRALRKL